VVRNVCEQEALSYVILRPPMVYGPGMKGNPLRLFRAVDHGMPLPVAGATNRRSMMYVDNLVAAIVASLRLPLGTRQTFVVGDSEPVSTAALVREIAEALDRPAWLVPVPRWLMRAAAGVGDALNRVVPFPLTSTAVERLFGSLAVDYSRFARSAGYSPPIERTEAMRRSAAWLRQAR
jgi:nucleoside-diphosphate-sugar epimerase